MSEPDPSTTSDSVKVAIPIKREPGDRRQRYEWMFAGPVGTPNYRGDGIYCLYNTSFCSAFGLGDLVEVRCVGKRLEVVRLHQRSANVSYWVAIDELADPGALSALREAWAANGSWVEGLCEHQLVVTVPPIPSTRPSREELDELKTTMPLRELAVIAHPDDHPDDPYLFGHLRRPKPRRVPLPSDETAS